MKIRDLFIEVRLRGEKAVRDLISLDRLTKRSQAALTRAGKAATAFGKDVRAGASKAADAMEKAGKAAGSMGGMFGGLGGLAKRGLQEVGGAMAAAVGKAIDFETSMAEISKVVDGLKTPTGEVTAEFDKMKESIFDLSSEIAIAPKGFADIIAAAGQAGIAKDELQGFAADAAKMAVAFDIGADEAGAAMAKMRTGLGLTQTEVFNLAGTMNHLSNNMASAAPEITDVVKRIGAMGGSAGLTGEQVAGLGSAMIASGAKVNVSATGIKNFTLALAAGEAATLRQRTGYERLGLTAEEVSKQFGKGGNEAEAAMRKVLLRLKGMDQAERASTIMQIFGRESMGAIAPLVTQIENFDNAMTLAADKTAAATSVQKEFDIRSKTTANAIQLLKNNIEIAAIKVGDAFLPAINEVVDFLTSPSVLGMGDSLIEGIKTGVTVVIDLFKRIGATVVPIIESVAAQFGGFVDGVSEHAGRIFEVIGPLFEAIGSLAMTILEALGMAGEEGAAFGEQMGDGLGGVAVVAVESLTAAVAGLTEIIEALKPVVGPVAAFLKDVLGGALDFVAGVVEFLKGQFEGVSETLQAFTSGRFADGFARLGQMILDGLVEPLRIVTRMLIDLADAVPGGSELVPAAMRAFAGRTAIASVAKMAAGVSSKSTKAGERAEAEAAAAPMMAGRAEQQGIRKTKRKMTQDDIFDIEGDYLSGSGEEASGGGKGGRKGRKGKKKADNLLDQAVADAKAGKYVLGGSDRSTGGVGPSVTNMYQTFNFDIDARGAEGQVANVERAGRRAGERMGGMLRGVDQAAMRARAGGGVAAGNG